MTPIERPFELNRPEFNALQGFDRMIGYVHIFRGYYLVKKWPVSSRSKAQTDSFMKDDLGPKVQSIT